MMKVLIVDDEEKARKTLIQLSKICCPDITSFIEADSVATAVEKIQKDKPDLVFLDITLGDGTGFDVLEQLKDMMLNVIFVTAHHEYGINAIKASAIDYLLKPIRSTELIVAVTKAKERLGQQDITKHVDLLLQNTKSKEEEVSRIIVKTADSIHLIKVEEIVFCESDKGYTTFHLLSGFKIISSKILSEYESILAPPDFMRIHQSFLVNLNHVIRYDKKDSQSLITIGNHELPVSVRRKEALLAYFDKLAQ